MTGAAGGNTNQSCIISTGGLNIETSLGCYRPFIARSSTPLGDGVFNDYRVADRVLPQNGNQYLRRYWDPTQGWSLMGHFGPAPPGTPYNVWPSAFRGYPTDLSSLSYDLTHPWWYETTTWVMNSGERINLPNGFLQYQGDGNLVLYNAYSTPLWATGTSGPDYCASGRCRAQFQGDGNLVLYRDYLDGNTHYWASGADGIGHILIFGIRPAFYHLGIQDYNWQWVFCDDHRCGP
jgi:D-mannose binding lectin